MVGEEFSDGSSFLHSLDPRVKVITAVFFSVLVAVNERLPSLLLAAVFAAALVALARLAARKVIFRLLVVNGFVLFLWLFLPFSVAGEELFSVGPLVGTREGTMQALLITVKSNTIILAGMALLATSSIIAIAHALSHLYVPTKLIHLAFFTYRYIHVLYLEYVRLINAVRIRGFKPATSLHTYRTYAYLVGMLLLRSYERSERVYQAMLCRGFKGTFWMLDHFHLRWQDVAAGAAMLLVTSLVLW